MTEVTALNRTLYRSLIRWTRNKLARSVPFVVDTHVLPLEVRRFLPLNAVKVRNAIGVRSCIRWCYRTTHINKDTAVRDGYEYDPVGASLESLKFLSEFQQVLKEKDALRQENIQAEEYLLNLRKTREFSSTASQQAPPSSSSPSHPPFSVPPMSSISLSH